MRDRRPSIGDSVWHNLFKVERPEKSSKLRGTRQSHPPFASSSWKYAANSGKRLHWYTSTGRAHHGLMRELFKLACVALLFGKSQKDDVPSPSVYIEMSNPQGYLMPKMVPLGLQRAAYGVVVIDLPSGDTACLPGRGRLPQDYSKTFSLVFSPTLRQGDEALFNKLQKMRKSRSQPSIASTRPRLNDV